LPMERGRHGVRDGWARIPALSARTRRLLRPVLHVAQADGPAMRDLRPELLSALGRGPERTLPGLSHRNPATRAAPTRRDPGPRHPRPPALDARVRPGLAVLPRLVEPPQRVRLPDDQ